MVFAPVVLQLSITLISVKPAIPNNASDHLGLVLMSKTKP